MYSETKLSEVSVYNVLYALDSTTISTSIVLATWALGKYSKGAVKMHTLLDLRGSIPASIHITDGNGMTVTSWIGLSQSHLHFI